MQVAAGRGARRAAVVLLVVAAVVGANAYWWRLGRPVDVPDAHATRIACVSYSPYRKVGETPFDPRQTVSRARIEEDLAALSRRFDCVRTYSVASGLAAVPEVARRHHMKVYLGIWLSRTAADNERELALGIATANANRDVVSAVVVGNEVLLRGELPQEVLAGHIRRVAAATGLPVTYADVWEFWLRYRAVEKAVSFLTIHILPYWEDDPVAIDAAIDHVAAVRAQIQAAFPGRDILIGETGWPSAGRQRRAAVPSLVNEARFIRAFLDWADANGARYNIIEAFDQPWKRQLEGTVGGYWGVYDSAALEKFSLTGPVVEEPAWRWGILGGLAGALVCVAAGIVGGRFGPGGVLVLALGGDALGAVLVAALRYMALAERDAMEWGLTGAVAGLSLVTATACLWRVARAFDAQLDLPAPSIWHERAQARLPRLARVHGALRLFWLGALATLDVLLVFDPRYRDFPIFLYAPALVGLVAAGALAAPRVGRERAVEERWAAIAILAASLYLVVAERPSNGVADLWVCLGVFFGLAVLREVRPGSAVDAVDADDAVVLEAR